MPDERTSKRPSSDRQLARTIGKSTIFGILASAIQVGTRLITVPVVIYHLGLGGYGIWSIIMATAAYMRFGTAGIKSAFQKYVAEATGNGNFEAASRLVSTGSMSMLVLSFVGLIPIAVFSNNLAKTSGVPLEFLPAAASSLTVLALIFVIANFGAAFEAIVMGGHRVDLARKFNIVTTVCEAIAIIAFLHFGYGLFAMAVVMGASELIYILCCYISSRRILPEIRVSLTHFSKDVFPELFRFVGSYQLVNILEVLYVAILPIFILRFFGADAAGIYAVASRVAASALVAQDALLLPLLSGGAVVFTSGSLERIQRFLQGSFKALFMVTLPPLAFVSAFGSTTVLAWAGETGHFFGVAIALVSLASLFKAVSLLQLVLYRATGRALLDNIRQILRIVILLIVAFLGRTIGFHGVLIGLAVAELAGVVFMFFTMSATFRGSSPGAIMCDALRLMGVTAAIIAAGFVAAKFPVPGGLNERLAAVVKLGAIGIACSITAWPAFILTGTVSIEERSMVLEALMPWRRKALAIEQRAPSG